MLTIRGRPNRADDDNNNNIINNEYVFKTMHAIHHNLLRFISRMAVVCQIVAHATHRSTTPSAGVTPKCMKFPSFFSQFSTVRYIHVACR